MFKTRYIFLMVIMALFDTFFAYAFPVDFTFRSMSFISHLCLMGLLIWTARLEWMDRLLAGALCGILFDFFFVSSFPTSFILFPLLTLANGWIYQQLEDDFRWLYGLAIVSIYLYDWIPFMTYKLFGKIHVGFISWFIHVELATLLFHSVAIIGYHYLSRYMEANENIDVQQGNTTIKKRVRRLRPMGK